MSVLRFFRKQRVWGFLPSDLVLRFEGKQLDGLVRPGSKIGSVVIRPSLGDDHYRTDIVRQANRDWLKPWDATLPDTSKEVLPTWSQYARKLDGQMRNHESLTMMVKVDREIAGQVTLGAVEHGAMSQGTLGYWLVRRWSGVGVASLAVAAVIDMVISDLGLHRIEVNVKPENERSLALCKNLQLRREGYKPRYMCIAGRWADHISFGVDEQDLQGGSMLERIRRN